MAGREQKSKQQRGAPRIPVAANVFVVADGELVRAAISDFSTHGCRVALPDLILRPGQFVKVRSGVHQAEAIVRWSEGTTAGLEFARPVVWEIGDGLLGRT